MGFVLLKSVQGEQLKKPACVLIFSNLLPYFPFYHKIAFAGPRTGGNIIDYNLIDDQCLRAGVTRMLIKEKTNPAKLIAQSAHVCVYGLHI